MTKTPLQTVKERFGSKAALVEQVKAFMTEDLWVSRTNQNKGLERVSNAKLLRLHKTFSHVKETFGTREKLIEAILTIENRTKDDGYRRRLLKYPVPRLLDHHNAAEKRAKAAKKPAERV